MYIALIGDIINSKKIENRQDIQEHIQDIFKELLTLFPNAFASNPTLTLGDEFQMLFKNAAYVIPCIELLKQRIDPIQIRFGIGFGDILTDIDPYQSIGADGPAYWHARRAIDNVKLHKDTDILFYSAFLTTDNLINEIFKFLFIQKSSFTPSQHKFWIDIFDDYYLQNIKQYQLAEKLGVQTQSISAKLKAMHYKQILHAHNTLTQTFHVLLEETL